MDCRRLRHLARKLCSSTPLTKPGGIKAPCFTWEHGPFEVIFLDNNGESDNSLGTKTSSIMKLLGDRVEKHDDNIEEKGEEKSYQEERLVLIMRSPLDVMKDHTNVYNQAILQFHKYQSPAPPPEPELIEEEPSKLDQPEGESLVEIPVMATIVDEPTEEQKKELRDKLRLQPVAKVQ